MARRERPQPRWQPLLASTSVASTALDIVCAPWNSIVHGRRFDNARVEETLLVLRDMCSCSVVRDDVRRPVRGIRDDDARREPREAAPEALRSLLQRAPLLDAVPARRPGRAVQVGPGFPHLTQRLLSALDIKI